ncbi:MAG: hypothetical protein M1837_004516 [Sclerophora amabilis]|nr:MAG: hypothetical protein M1837_004516 [Sclerophora amabilis]
MAEEASAIDSSPKPPNDAASARPDPEDTKVDSPDMTSDAPKETSAEPEAKDAAADVPETSHDLANGGAEKGDTETSDKKPDLPNADEASAEGGGEDAAALETSTAAAVEPTSNGTPASSKKNKRKSSTGVPEHKTKKLGKKKSQVFTHINAQPGEYYFARLKGHAPWPSIICDEEMLPAVLLASRPVTARRTDGSYRDDFADGGKRVNERTFPVMFLGSNEFCWIANTDLTDLNLDTIEEQAEKAKSKGLKAAYLVAAERNDLAHFKDVLRDHDNALQADLEAKAERAKKAKSKRKSDVVKEESEDVEMEDVEDEAALDENEVGEVSKSKSKKRKKEVESDGEATKPPKTPKRTDSTKKSTPKLKLTKPKTPNGTTEGKSATKTASSTKAAKAAKPKGTPTKKKVVVKVKPESEDEEMADESPKTEERPLSMTELREKKQKSILFLRHKLQKGFLTRDQTPREEEMKTMSDYIGKLESYADLEVSIIRATKINKVLKAVMKLSSIPRDDEFSFKQRSHDLLQTWNRLLSRDAEGGNATGSAPDDEPVANGVIKEEKSYDEKEDKETEEAEEAGTKEVKKESEKETEKTTSPQVNEALQQAEENTAALESSAPADEEGSKTDVPAVTEADATSGENGAAPQEADTDQSAATQAEAEAATT